MNIIHLFLILVTFKSIQSVPFPSVTVCASNSGKWQALVEALDHYDEYGLIFEVLKNTRSILGYLKAPFDHNSPVFELILKQFEPRLELDHALPEKLKLLPIEKEVFYILHFACYAMEQLTKDYCPSHEWDEAIFDMSLGKINHQQTAIEIRENLCEKVLNCTAINILNSKNIPTWKDCNRNETNPMHQNWCKNCTNLYECLKENRYDKDYFLRFIVNTFFTWRKYYNKRNVIDSFISTYLYKPPSNIAEYMSNEIPKYAKTLHPFPEHNLTLLDLWAYTNLKVIENINALVGENIPIAALRNCTSNQSKESCHLVQEFSKEIGNKDKKDLETIYQNIFDGLIPFCSYASDHHILHICNSFKKMNNGKCFTFNESSFDHTLGQTQGLNFVVNYDYPGTSTDLGRPITIMLHESSQKPDVKNIIGMNFRAVPGHILDLKISATAINSTEAFDAMDFNSRLCNDGIENGEFNCISDNIIGRAIRNCGCQPWYLSYPKIETCDTLGMICYDKSFANGTKDVNLKESCYESCKNVKYSLILLENSPIDKTLNIDLYGEEFKNYLIKPERLYPYLNIYNEEQILEKRLKRMSIIHVNFEKSKVWTVTKDAKISLPDMVGNIGGTLGVFIGFSFLGLLDTLIEGMQYFQRKMKSLRNPKSSLPL